MIRTAVYRIREGVPTEAGWYYGRPIGFRANERIIPIEVAATRGVLTAVSRRKTSALSDFEWFGQVLECEEVK